MKIYKAFIKRYFSWMYPECASCKKPIFSWEPRSRIGPPVNIFIHSGCPTDFLDEEPYLSRTEAYLRELGYSEENVMRSRRYIEEKRRGGEHKRYAKDSRETKRGERI